MDKQKDHMVSVFFQNECKFVILDRKSLTIEYFVQKCKQKIIFLNKFLNFASNCPIILCSMLLCSNTGCDVFDVPNGDITVVLKTNLGAQISNEQFPIIIENFSGSGSFFYSAGNYLGTP